MSRAFANRSGRVQAGELAAFIRRLAPNHTLIYGPAGSQNVRALEAIAPLEVSNVVYAVHFYEPLEFTHQGLDWGGDDNPLRYLQGVPFPLRQGDAGADSLVSALTAEGRTEAAARLQAAMTEGWDDERIQAAFAPLAAWAVEYRKPIIVDEFGVLGRYADLGDRSRWLRAVRTAAERYCFGWTHWEFAEGFGFLNASGSDIEPELAEGLLGKPGN